MVINWPENHCFAHPGRGSHKAKWFTCHRNSLPLYLLCISTYHTVVIAHVAKVNGHGRGRPEVVPSHGVLAPVRRAPDLPKVSGAVTRAQASSCDGLTSGTRELGALDGQANSGGHKESEE